MQNVRNLFYKTWTEAEQLFAQSDAVVILLGSVEEHGPHLPLGTDSILAEAVAEQLCNRLNLYYYPCITFGEVWSAKDFSGTVSITPEALKMYLKDAVISLNRLHTKRVVLYSFHNGNLPVMKAAVRELRDEAAIENVYWLGMPNLHQKAENILTTPVWNGSLWHAGELETSLMLYAAPQLVKPELAPCEFPQKPMGYESAAIPWKTFLKSGAFGDAAAATAQKGEMLFHLLLDELEQRMCEILQIEIERGG